MLLVLGLVLVTCFSIIVTSILGFKNRISILLSYYLLGTSNVIFVAEIAGIFQKVNDKWFFVLMHMLLAIVAFLIWWHKNRPKLISIKINTKSVRKWINVIKQDRFLWAFAIGVLLIYLLNAIVIIVFHANTNDSLAVHLARIGYWLQSGSFRPWPTENIYQITYPFNAQVQMLWTILLSGTDQLVEFVQWFSAIFGIIAITGIASVIGYTKKQGLFAGLIWATLPMISLQSTTTQNDLITASVILIGLYYLVVGIKNQNGVHLIISGLAFGISLGIKQTAFFIIPGIGISFLLFIIKYKKTVLKSTVIFVSSVLIAFLLLGSYVYISNLVSVPDDAVSSTESETVVVQTPFGPSDYVVANMGLNRTEKIKDSLLINTSRYFFQAADLTGIPIPIKNRLGDIRESFFRLFFETLNVPVESDRAVGRHVFSLSFIPLIYEDEAWFGLLGFLLLFLTPIELLKFAKTKNVFPFVLFFVSLSVTLCITIFRNNWTPYQARYMVTVYFKPHHKASIIKVLCVLTISIFALSSLLNVIWNNEAKPLSSPRAIFSGDRLKHYSFSGGYLVNIVKMVDEHVPDDATLGLAIGRNWEYPFFGENFTRKLVPIYPSSHLINVDWLLDNEINYILVDTDINDKYSIPHIYQSIISFDNFTVLGLERK